MSRAHSVCREGIQVAVRVRPAPSEDEDGAVSVGGRTVSVRHPKPHKSVSCDFDAVLGEDASQDDVFRVAEPVLESALAGFNATIFAYGQTGSGKTHSMMGPDGGTQLASDPAHWGIVPRALRFLFARLDAKSREEESSFAYSLHCSYLQIGTNERLVDLLREDEGGEPLQIRDERQPAAVGGMGRGPCGSSSGSGNAKGTAVSAVYVRGLSEFRVGNVGDVMALLQAGAARRSIRATQYNEFSSRSHAVLQLAIETEAVTDSGRSSLRRAKLSLVDLAGSERFDTSGFLSREHINELRGINSSLSALGNVIAVLASGRRGHVPYRDSKLTRLLQDSLGGNTRTAVLCCVAPGATAASETVSTLAFADRARRVMIRLRPNEAVDDRALLVRANAEISRLRALLAAATAGSAGAFAAGSGRQCITCGGSSSGSGDIATLQAQVIALSNELVLLRAENAALLRRAVTSSVDREDVPSRRCTAESTGALNQLQESADELHTRAGPSSEGDGFGGADGEGWYSRLEEQIAHAHTPPADGTRGGGDGSSDGDNVATGGCSGNGGGGGSSAGRFKNRDGRKGAASFGIGRCRALGKALLERQHGEQRRLDRQREHAAALLGERRQLEARLASLLEVPQVSEGGGKASEVGLRLGSPNRSPNPKAQGNGVGSSNGAGLQSPTARRSDGTRALNSVSGTSLTAKGPEPFAAWPASWQEDEPQEAQPSLAPRSGSHLGGRASECSAVKVEVEDMAVRIMGKDTAACNSGGHADSGGRPPANRSSRVTERASARIRALRASYPVAPSTKIKRRRFNNGAGLAAPGSGAGNDRGSGSGAGGSGGELATFSGDGSLTSSVDDLGVRLRVYSFRYDCWY